MAWFWLLFLLAWLAVPATPCVLCPLRLPPRPRPLDQFQLPPIPQVDTERIPKFCNLTTSLPVRAECRKAIANVFCGADELIEALVEGCAAEDAMTCSLCEKRKKSNLWLLSWFDSVGKMPAGVSDGNFYWLGDYEICHNLKTSDSFAGKYCRLRLEVPDALVEAGCPQHDPLHIIYGLCAPVECDDDELSAVAYQYSAYKVDVDCELEAGLSITTKILVGLCILWMAWLVLATALEWKGMGPDWMICFSIRVNGARAFSTRRRNNMHAVHGLEVVSFAFFVAGCVYNMMLPFIENVAFSFDGVSSLGSHLTNNFSFHVDGILALSAFFSASLLSSRADSTTALLGSLANKLLRFWPAYAFVILFMTLLFPSISSGPLWIHGETVERCESNWWKNLFFINNFFSVRETCVDFGYAVSLDVQFFLVLLVLSRISNINSKAATGISYLLLLFSLSLNFYLIYWNGLLPSPIVTAEPVESSKVEILLDSVVTSFFCRLPAVLLAFLFSKLAVEKTSQWMRGLASSACLILAPLTAFYLLPLASGNPGSPLMLAVYGATHRAIWVSLLLTVAALCHSGYLPSVSAFVGWRVFSPMAKQVLLASVVAEPIILYFFSALHRPAYATHWSTLYAVVSAAGLSLVAALVLDVTVARPLRLLLDVKQRQQTYSTPTASTGGCQDGEED